TKTWLMGSGLLGWSLPGSSLLGSSPEGSSFDPSLAGPTTVRDSILARSSKDHRSSTLSPTLSVARVETMSLSFSGAGSLAPAHLTQWRSGPSGRRTRIH